MKIHIKRFFDKAADCYDESADIQRLIAEKLLELTDEVRPNQALEIGTGSGLFTRLFLEKCCPAHFIGLDIAYSMAKTCCNMNGLFIQADGERLPIRQNSADVLVSSSVLQWFQKPEKSIPLALKTLKKGGRFYFSVFCEGTFAEMNVLHDLTGFGMVYPLRRVEFYQELLSAVKDIEFTCEAHDYILRFNDVRTFLKKQQNTGAGFTGRKTAAGKESYRRFCDMYESFFGDSTSIPVTYRIAYIKGSIL
jgi:malonyl-CoA O-methyltransferase